MKARILSLALLAVGLWGLARGASKTVKERKQ